MKRKFTERRLDGLFTLGRDKNVSWRHDVDFSVDAALKMAEFEAERGISATYYLFALDDCPFYSTLDALQLEKELFKLGHRTGVHVDERKYSPFSDYFPLTRVPVSFHCPTERVLWKDFFMFENAYAARWRGRYMADSEGKFRFGDPEDVLDGGEVQINLHPEWWFEKKWWKEVSPEQYEAFFYIGRPE